MHPGSRSHRQILSSQRWSPRKEEEARFGHGCRSQPSSGGPYDGSLPADLNKQIREELGPYIVPSTNTLRGGWFTFEYLSKTATTK